MTVSLRGFTSLMGLDAMDGGTASMRKLSAGELDCDDGTDVVLDVLVPLLVLFLMFGMGATVTFQQLKDAAIAQPKALLTGAFCQFGIMPLIAFVLGKITDLSTSLAISLLVVGVCPGGTTSQLFSYWANGDVALSIAMTVFSTTTALFMQPFLLFVYMEAIDPDTTLKVAYVPLIATLLVVLVPVCVGAYINQRNPVLAKKCAMVGSVAGALVVAVAIVYGSIVESHIYGNGANVWVCALTFLPLGMFAGYAISRWVTKLSPRHQRTVSFESGVQNSSLGIAIVVLSFSSGDCVSRELLTFPLIYSALGITEAFVIALVWGQYPADKPPSKAFLANQVHTHTEHGADGKTITVYRSPLAKDGLITAIPGDNATTLYENFFRAGMRRHPLRPCLGTRAPQGAYSWINYEDVAACAMAVGRGLVTLGAQRQDKVALFSINRAEWVIAEQGCNAFSLVTVPLYNTLGPDAASYITTKTRAFAIVCSKEHQATAEAIVQEAQRQALESGEEARPKYVVVMDGLDNILRHVKGAEFSVSVNPPEAGAVLSLSTVAAMGRANPVPTDEPGPADIATICFTSGTTGTPKGAVLTHANMIACMAGGFMHTASGLSNVSVTLNEQDVHISYLPLAHMFERAVHMMLYRSGAAIGFFGGDPKKLVDDMRELKPTLFPAVPRVLNRLYSAIQQRLRGLTGAKKRLIDKAFSTKRRLMLEKNITTHGFFDAVVFSKMTAATGGRVRLMITGAAPISRAVLQFCRIVFACPLLEGYGQTETSAASHMTCPGDMSVGHVGIPLPCTEVMLEDVPDMNYLTTDPQPRGEVCFRGANIFQGYFEEPEKTREALHDGWLHSGDIGRINPNGTLSIIDRRKSLLKLSQGEYVSPEKVEGIYGQHAAVNQVWIHGDSLHRFVVAFVVAEEGSENVDPAILLSELQALGKDAGLHSFEQAKRVHITTEAFTVENHLITPTMKLRRHDLRQHFVEQIRGFYGKESSDNVEQASKGAAKSAGSGAGVTAAGIELAVARD